jgi:hypothetical protein
MRCLVFFVLTILFFVSSCTNIETKAEKSLLDNTSLPDNTEELIDLLANSNNSENLAKKSYDKLIKMKEKALPSLVAHSDDERLAAGPYQGFYSIMGDATVGFVCFDIIAQIVGFESGKHAASCFVFPNQCDLKKWYEQRKAWSLAEIRTEILYCRIKHIEETNVDFLWAMDDKEKEHRLRELRRKISEIDKSITKRQYAWQEPTNLDKDKVFKMAQTYLSDKGCQLQDYPEHKIFYAPLVDSWNVLVMKDISSDKKHYFRLTIDDTTSSIEYEEWDD